MKINKKSILEVFIVFKSVYPEFEKKMQNEQRGRETVQAWKEVFETIEFDYKYANIDFIEGAKKAVSKSKYIPTIAEILEEMKNLYKDRIEKEAETKRMQMWKIEEKCDLRSGNIESAIKYYNRLKEKYSDEEIKKQVQKYKEEQKLSFAILATEDVFEKIME